MLGANTDGSTREKREELSALFLGMLNFANFDTECHSANV